MEKTYIPDAFDDKSKQQTVVHNLEVEDVYQDDCMIDYLTSRNFNLYAGSHPDIRLFKEVGSVSIEHTALKYRF